MGRRQIQGNAAQEHAPGQRVEFTIDAYPGRTLTGHVASVQPGSGAAFSLLPAENATGKGVYERQFKN
jgi:multidrug resistance efflux pump